MSRPGSLEKKEEASPLFFGKVGPDAQPLCGNLWLGTKRSLQTKVNYSCANVSLAVHSLGGRCSGNVPTVFSLLSL